MNVPPLLKRKFLWLSFILSMVLLSPRKGNSLEARWEMAWVEVARPRRQKRRSWEGECGMGPPPPVTLRNSNKCKPAFLRSCQDGQKVEFSNKARSKQGLNWTSKMQGRHGGCLTWSFQRSQESHIFQNLWWSKGPDDGFHLAAEATASHPPLAFPPLHHGPIHSIILGSLGRW